MWGSEAAEEEAAAASVEASSGAIRRAFRIINMD